jgi:hypothetical protein
MASSPLAGEVGEARRRGGQTDSSYETHTTVTYTA